VNEQRGRGKVYLVGAGPGHPGLITVRGRQLLAEADAVVYDRLLSPRLLAAVRLDCTCFYVGKQACAHTLRQSEINQLLIDLALAGKTVVRLKGGDPFVFGRGGEEAEALTAAGIEWEVVPGITSAVAVPAFAGIPLTHREVSPGFTVATGHRDSRRWKGAAAASDTGNRASQPVTKGPASTPTPDSEDWTPRTPAERTLVVLMGIGHLAELVQAWLDQGWPASTPVAIVRWGTRAAQQTLVGTLATIVEQATAAHLRPPAVIVLGEVVRLRDNLAWFERRPLAGRRILVAAETADEASRRADELQELGAEVYEVSLEHRFAPNLDQLRRLSSRLGLNLADVGHPVDGGDYGPYGLLFTSGIGIEWFFEYLQEDGVDLRALAGIRLAAADWRLAERLRRHGIQADWVAAGTGAVPYGHAHGPWLVELLEPKPSRRLEQAVLSRLTKWEPWHLAAKGVREHGVFTALRRELEEAPLDACWLESEVCVWLLQEQGLLEEQVPVFAMHAEAVAALADFGVPAKVASSGQDLADELLSLRPVEAVAVE
jgi:uroporphyrinogen III methyltransferase/synthase